MNIRKLALAIVATAATVAPAAHADLVTLVEAIELSPSNIIIPGSQSGMVTFRPCAEDCDAQYDRARLTSETQFLVDGRRVRFEDFSKDFATIRTSRDGYALVSVDTKSNTVTSIEISR